MRSHQIIDELLDVRIVTAREARVLQPHAVTALLGDHPQAAPRHPQAHDEPAEDTVSKLSPVSSTPSNETGAWRSSGATTVYAPSPEM